MSLTGKCPETPGPIATATASSSRATPGPHVRFDPIVTADSGSTTQLNQGHELDSGNPFIDAGGSNISQRSLFSTGTQVRALQAII